jgi:tetratricopeptide (TPR) repeat protein
MKHKTKKSAEESHSHDFCLLSILTPLCLLIIVIHFIASFFPQGRIWGLNQWAYLPHWVCLPATLLSLFFFVPRFNRFAVNTTKALTSPVFQYTGERKHLWYLVLSLLFFILFWMLKTKTYFLGDGYQILSNVETGEFSFRWTEPLETLLHLKAFKLGGTVFNLDVETVYAILSCVAGTIFVYLSLLFSDFLGKEKAQKILALFILISMGSTQLFYGYVEHYSFLFVFVFGFLLLSVTYLEGRTRLIFPILAFISAFLFHISALCLLPSLFFLFLLAGKKSRFERVKNILLGLFVVFLVLIIFWAYKRYSWSVPPLFVPFIQGRYTGPDYTLFSLSHLLDILNQQLLAAPVGLILILGALICGKGKALLRDRISQFLLIVALSQLFSNFLVDPGLGASRDWDMFSAMSLGYVLLGLYLLLRFFNDRTRFQYLAVILVITSLHSTVPWIALNSSESKSIQRFRNLLLIDPKKSQNGHFVLFKYFKTRGQEDEAIKQNDVQRVVLPELPLIADAKKLLGRGELDSAEAKLLLAEQLAPRLATIHDNLGMVYLAKGDLDKAKVEFRRAIELASFVAGQYFNLANVYAVEGNMDAALELYEKVIFLQWPHPEPYHNVGLILFQKGDLNRAEEFFEKTLKVDSDFEDAYVGLGNVYREKGQFPKAVEMYQAAIQLKPDLAKVHLRLGMTYLQIDSKEEAIRELQRFLELAPEAKNAEQVQKLLRELME